MLWEVPCQAQQQPVRKEVSFEIRFFSEYRCRDWGECKKWQQTCAQNEAEHKGVVTTDVQCETFCHQNQMKPAVKWPVTKSSCCLIGCCTCYWREALPAEHVLRLPPHHPSRAILDFDPGSFGWKWPRGAPRTRWFDVVKRDLDQRGLDPAAIEPLAKDRDKWRALVNLVGSTHNAPTGGVHETRWWWWLMQISSPVKTYMVMIVMHSIHSLNSASSFTYFLWLPYYVKKIYAGLHFYH